MGSGSGGMGEWPYHPLLLGCLIWQMMSGGGGGADIWRSASVAAAADFPLRFFYNIADLLHHPSSECTFETARRA